MLWVILLSGVGSLETDISTAKLELLRDTALTLPELDRAKLASELMASLDGPKELDVENAWDIEICRRINEIEQRSAKLLDLKQVLKISR